MDIAESVQCHKVMVTMKVINGRDIFWGGLALRSSESLLGGGGVLRTASGKPATFSFHLS